MPAIDHAMTDHPHIADGRKREREERVARLSKALRDNLHRRKEQARAREEMPRGEAPANGRGSAVSAGDRDPSA